jgi:steroid delta-isomerase
MFGVRRRIERLTLALAGAFLAWVALALSPGAAADEAARAQIAAALTQWTVDFNAGRADRVCDLFAPDLRANVRGAPERGHAAQCDLLQRSLADRTRSYSYAFAIKEILVWGDVAVVRLTWTLTVRPRDSGRATTSIEPGLDVFRRQADGRWRIIRYMAYEE